MVHRNSGVHTILILALAVSFGASSAWAACECPTMPTVPEALAGATAVFEGTVVEQIPAIVWYEPVKGDRRLLPTQKVRFQVHRVWKGQVGREITILEGDDDCASWFQRSGEKRLIFATPHESAPGRLGVNRCAQPWGIGSKDRLIVSALGEPVKSWTGPLVPAGWASAVTQHPRVYSIAGIGTLYSQLRGDLPLDEEWGWLPGLQALLGVSWIGAAMMIWRRFSFFSAFLLMIVVTALYIAVLGLAAGAVVVHQNGAWLQHLLDGFAIAAESGIL